MNSLFPWKIKCYTSFTHLFVKSPWDFKTRLALQIERNWPKLGWKRSYWQTNSCFGKFRFILIFFVKPTLQDIYQLTRQILLRLVYEQRSWVTEFGHMLNTSAFQVSVELILMVVLFKYLHKLKQKQFSYLHFCDAFLKPGVGEFWGGCGFFCFPEAKSIHFLSCDLLTARLLNDFIS